MRRGGMIARTARTGMPSTSYLDGMDAYLRHLLPIGGASGTTRNTATSCPRSRSACAQRRMKMPSPGRCSDGKMTGRIKIFMRLRVDCTDYEKRPAERCGPFVLRPRVLREENCRRGRRKLRDLRSGEVNRSTVEDAAAGEGHRVTVRRRRDRHRRRSGVYHDGALVYVRAAVITRAELAHVCTAASEISRHRCSSRPRLQRYQTGFRHHRESARRLECFLEHCVRWVVREQE